MFGAEALRSMAAAPAPATTVVGPGGDSLAPRCWRTVYSLLNLYANMPDADTITHRLVSVSPFSTRILFTLKFW